MNILLLKEKSTKFVHHPERYLTLFVLNNKSMATHKLAPYSWLDDKYWLEYFYYLIYGYRLDLKQPKTFNEKMQWLKLYDRNPLYAQLADKWAARDYYLEKLGPAYLKPVIGVYQQPDEIDWTGLPARFAIKLSSGSGWNIICPDRSTLDVENAMAKLREWSKLNFYHRYREWQYKEIEPRILVEAYLESGDDLGFVEYRFFCFGGKPEFIQVEVDMNGDHRRAFFTKEWGKAPFFMKKYPPADRDIPRPANLAEMFATAERLSEGIPFCRVDLNSVSGQILVSEVTFMPGGGYQKIAPDEYNDILGDMIQLPKETRISPRFV